MTRKYLAIAGSGLLLAAGSVCPVLAGEAAVCHSPLQYTTSTGTVGTQVYPQLANSTRFVCQTSGVSYTIPQLAQLGWEISQVVPTIYSITVQSNGTVIQRQRQQLIIQK